MEEETCKMKYKIKKGIPLRIFGENFVKNNINKAKLIINNKKSNLIEFININNINIFNDDEIKIGIILNKNISNKSYMFKDCQSLLEFSIKNTLEFLEEYDNDICLQQNNLDDDDNSELENSSEGLNFFNTENNSVLSSDSDMEVQSDKISDISKYSYLNLFDQIYKCCGLQYIFYNCKSLKFISNINAWNTNYVNNMSFMFYGCESLEYLPDISNWKTNNVNNMNHMFFACKSLNSLPNISKWNTNKVYDMSYMFCLCSSLISIPDISKWNINNVEKMTHIFYNCEKLSYLPDLSKWNTFKVNDISYMFSRCKNLIALPNISKWKTDNVIDMNNLFSNCESLSSFPDISIGILIRLLI